MLQIVHITSSRTNEQRYTGESLREEEIGEQTELLVSVYRFCLVRKK